MPKLITNLLKRIWKPFITLGEVLNFCRFSVFVVLVAAFLLLISDQGKEITLRVTDSLGHTIALYFGLLAWAFQSWFSARWVIHSVYDQNGEIRRVDQALSPQKASPVNKLKCWLIDHLPRLIGVAAFAIAAIALAAAGSRQGWQNTAHILLLILVVLSGVALYYFALSTYVSNRMTTLAKQSGFGETNDDRLRKLRYWSNRITGIYAVLFTFIAFVSPASLGQALGSTGVLFFALSTIVPFGSWLVLVTRSQGFPMITTLLILALLFSWWNDNHDVRTFLSKPAHEDVNVALDRWLEQAPSKSDNEQIKPMIVVATAGGGIRAAHWTSTVIGALADSDERAQKALFAISGVSGGSVGAAVATAVLHADQQCQEDAGQFSRSGTQATHCYEHQGRQVLSHDFLAPSLAGLLHQGLIQRFLPVPLNFLPDRQEALENGWEAAWAEQFPQQDNVLASPMAALWETSTKSQSWVPNLLFNSTHQESGKRIIASNLTIDPTVFNDTLDLFHLTGLDMPLSTSAGNSARFPGVSPAGTLACKEENLSRKGLWQYLFGATSCNNGHVLDGGYFENFGAVTARELLDGILESLADKQTKIQPLIVVISSDPGLIQSKEQLADTYSGRTSDEINTCLKRLYPESAGKAASAKVDWILSDHPQDCQPTNIGANEIGSVIGGLMNPRGARGILAAKQLRWWTEDMQLCLQDGEKCTKSGQVVAPKFFHFRMEVNTGEPEPALGWLLSKDSEQQICELLTGNAHNRAQFQELLLALDIDKARVNSVLKASVCGEAE